MVALPHYTQLDRVLRDSGCVVDAAECHGVLCGIICASGQSDMQGWVRYLFENREGDAEVSAESLGILHSVHEATLAEINHETLEFTLLLPDTEEALGTRAQGLSDWCAGFSFGLTLGGLNDKMLATGDSREFVEDIQHISSATLGDETGQDEQDEDSLVQIEEYVRMGVLLLNEELQPVKQSPTIH